MILSILNEISSEPSTNTKMDILSKYKDNKELKTVLYLGMSKRIKFYIKRLPDLKDITFSLDPVDLDSALNGLNKLYSREVTGNNAIAFVYNLLEGLSPLDAEVIYRIIKKDLKLGMGTTNVNKVIPNLIEKTPYMGAVPYSKSRVMDLLAKGRVYSQVKMDGRYLNAIIRDGDVEQESRQGETTHLQGAWYTTKLGLLSDCVLNGELTIPNIRREVSNGIITSLVDIGASRAKGNDVYKDILKFEKKHGDYINVLNSIVFTVWDCITVDEYFAKGSKTPYRDRLKRLETLVSDLGEDSNVKVIEYKEVTTFAEVMEHYNEMSRRGEEGTVVKSFDGRWENKKPTYQVKVKKVEFLDLKIVGFNFGGKGTKNEHLISSLDVESSDGLLKTSPCGMDEQTMNDITENREKYLGTIVEVKCSGLSFDSEGNYSCMHPVFKRIRDDKTIANSLEECIEIDRMVTELGNGE